LKLLGDLTRFVGLGLRSQGPQARLACRCVPQSRSIAGRAASTTKFGCRQPVVVDPKHLSDLGHAGPAVLQLLSRSPPRASRADFLAHSTSRSSSQLCMLSKHAEILSKPAEIVLKPAEKLGKQSTGR